MLNFTNKIEFKKELITFKIYLKKLTDNITSILFSIAFSLVIIFSSVNINTENISSNSGIFIALMFAAIFTGFDMINKFEKYLSPAEDRNIYQIFVLHQLTYKRIFKYRILLVGLFIFINKFIFILLLTLAYQYFKVAELLLFLLLAFINSVLIILIAVNTSIKHYQHEIDYEIIKTKTSMYVLLKFFFIGFTTFIFTMFCLILQAPPLITITIIIMFHLLLISYHYYWGSINNVYN